MWTSHNCPVGSVMQDPKPENCPHKAWKDRTAADGAVWKPRGRQHPPAGRRHIVSTHGWWWRSIRDWGSQISQGLWVQMFPIFPCKRLLMALWPQGRPEYTHQRLGVPQISQTLWVQMFPILPWERLLMALWHMLSGRDLQSLLPPSLGSQRRIPTWRGVALVKASLSKTKCPVVRNSVKPIPGWDMFQIDWGTGFYLQWPKGAFNPGPILVLLYAGKDDPLSLDSCLHSCPLPTFVAHVVAFDIRRSPQPLGHDLLDDQPYGKFCQAAIEGRVRLVCGGPNCRTWSILRWFPKPNAPVPVRGRSEDQCGDFPLLPHWSRKR